MSENYHSDAASEVTVQRCSACGADTDQTRVLITYECENETRAYAECAQCGEIIRF